jgi:hypothetical protein
MPTPTQNTLGGRDASVGFSMPNSGISPKGEKKMYPGSMGNTISYVKRDTTNQIDRIEEENSDNEGEGAASLHIKKNNYDKNKKK